MSTIVILLAVVIGFSFYSINTLNASSEHLGEHIAKIESSIMAGNWDSASKELSAFEETWNGTSKTWAMLLDHIEIDNIDNAFSKLSTYIDVKNQSLAIGEAAALKLYVKHIPEKEQLKFKNIL